MLNYKGYLGSVEFDDEADILHGDVINTQDVITFQGKSVAEVRQAFHDSVDEYLKFCAEKGKEPNKPFSGQFMTRIEPELHRKISTMAAAEKMSLNAWVATKLRGSVAKKTQPSDRPKKAAPQKVSLEKKRSPKTPVR